MRKVSVYIQASGWIVIEAERKKQMKYLYYSVDEAIKRYKEEVGIEDEELDIIIEEERNHE